MRNFFVFFCCLAWLTPLCGCERLRGLKDRLHGGEVAPTGGAVEVEVDPSEGISILLDEQPVAHRSPWRASEVAVGSHIVEVRGMGRYSVRLPVTVTAGGTVHLPVHLRLRPALPFGDAPPAAEPRETPLLAEAADAEPPTPRLAPVAAPQSSGTARKPGPTGRALPAGSQPLLISVTARPATAIWADGVPADADNVRLAQGQGTLKVGEMAMAYRIYPGRALEVTIPHDQAAWFAGNSQIKAKSRVRLTGTPVLVRRLAGGVQQQAVLRRVE